MAGSAVAQIPTPPKMSFDVDMSSKETEKSEQQEQQQKQRAWRRWNQWRPEWMKREEKEKAPEPIPRQQDTPPQTPETPTRPSVGRRLSRRVGVGMPRSQTFKRQEDEQRKNLEPVQTSAKERREVSRVRKRAASAQPVHPKSIRRQGSAPEVGYHDEALPPKPSNLAGQGPQQAPSTVGPVSLHERDASPPPPAEEQEPPQTEENPTEASYNDLVDEEIRSELEHKWILNLSMHFRDKSPREKFFVTYAETPRKWLRVTISVDYRDAPPDSLEADLQALRSQRDKNARVYESIRLSLPDIQFYDTVTNLKLETRDDRLHVHVTEDVNEIIPYPQTQAVQHLRIAPYNERDLHFVEHMSGFVYKVTVGNHTWIKKEIPGPDSVEEFLYEINALSELHDSRNVIELKGLVVNEDETLVKGLLIAFADRGALVDVIYDERGRLSWPRRERWARHIVRGLSEIHEAGFVQGDFTLSNIVIDSKDRAKIIDINRRGCPVGWEPPEIAKLIENRQRISMFIGVKSDLFQLGMVLWALAMEEDEPELQSRPLLHHRLPDDVPDSFRQVLQICLNCQPKNRLSCKELLLEYFPREQQIGSTSLALATVGQHFDILAETEPGQSIKELDFAFPPTNGDGAIPLESELNPLSHQTTFSDDLDLDSDGLIVKKSLLSPTEEGSGIFSPTDRGRSPAKNSPPPSSPSELHQFRSESTNDPTIISISPSADPRWAEITPDGNPYLVHRDTLESLDDERELEESRDRSRHPVGQDSDQRGSRRVGSGPQGGFEHVDSGLADMDFEGDLESSPVKNTEKADAGNALGGIPEHANLSHEETTVNAPPNSST